MSRARWQSRFCFCGAILLPIGLALWIGLALTNRQAAADLARRRRDLEGEIRRASAAAAAAQRASDAADRAMAEMSPPRPRELPRQKLPLDPADVELISANPELGAAHLRAERAYVKDEYGMFYRAQRLSPGQIAQFEKNFVAYRQAMLDLNALFLRQSEGEDKPTRALLADAEMDYETGQGGLLGIKGHDALQEYRNYRYLRSALVLPLAGAAALHGEPLSAEQGRRLAAAALDAVKQTGLARTLALPTSIIWPDIARNGSALNQVDWNAFKAKAAGVLSAGQFDLLEKVSMPSDRPTWRQFYLSQLVESGVMAESQAAAASAGK